MMDHGDAEPHDPATEQLVADVTAHMDAILAEGATFATQTEHMHDLARIFEKEYLGLQGDITLDLIDEFPLGAIIDTVKSHEDFLYHLFVEVLLRDPTTVRTDEAAAFDDFLCAGLRLVSAIGDYHEELSERFQQQLLPRLLRWCQPDVVVRKRIGALQVLALLLASDKSCADDVRQNHIDFIEAVAQWIIDLSNPNATLPPVAVDGTADSSTQRTIPLSRLAMLLSIFQNPSSPSEPKPAKMARLANKTISPLDQANDRLFRSNSISDPNDLDLIVLELRSLLDVFETLLSDYHLPDRLVSLITKEAFVDTLITVASIRDRLTLIAYYRLMSCLCVTRSFAQSWLDKDGICLMLHAPFPETLLTMVGMCINNLLDDPYVARRLANSVTRGTSISLCSYALALCVSESETSKSTGFYMLACLFRFPCFLSILDARDAVTASSMLRLEGDSRVAVFAYAVSHMTLAMHEAITPGSIASWRRDKDIDTSFDNNLIKLAEKHSSSVIGALKKLGSRELAAMVSEEFLGRLLERTRENNEGSIRLLELLSMIPAVRLILSRIPDGLATLLSLSTDIHILQTVVHMISGFGESLSATFSSAELREIFTAVRHSDGIRVLTNRLRSRQSDHLYLYRTLVCRALLSLCRDPTIQQILRSLRIAGVIEQMDRDGDPNLSRQAKDEHAQFKKVSVRLLAVLTNQRVSLDEAQSMVRRLEKQAVVQGTRVSYHESELLNLIYAHLVHQGLSKAAQMLKDEAHLDLPPVPAFSESTSALPSVVSLASLPSMSNLDASSALRPSYSNSAIHASAHSGTALNRTNSLSSTPIPLSLKLQNHLKSDAISSTAFTSPLPTSVSKLPFSASLVSPQPNISQNYNAFTGNPSVAQPVAKDGDQLHRIVLQYLKQQHRACARPYCIPPPFSLTSGHKCSEPLNLEYASSNLLSRVINAGTCMSRGSVARFSKDRQFAFSRYRHLPTSTIRAPVDSYMPFTCSAFLERNKSILVGSEAGTLAVYSLGQRDYSSVHEVPDSDVSHLILNDAQDVVACWGSTSHLYRSSNFGAPMQTFSCHALTFPHYVTDADSLNIILGTTDEGTAKVYDVRTAQARCEFVGEEDAAPAVFSYTGDVVLYNSCLWDIRTPLQPVHRFDKLAVRGASVFHPNNLHIILNSAVWDFRMPNRALIQTVSDLSDSAIKFCDHGRVIVSLRKDKMTSEFKVVDGSSYETIHTQKSAGEREIMNLAVDGEDMFVSSVEADENGERVVTLYEIGEEVGEDEEVEEGEDEEEEEGEDVEDVLSTLLFSEGGEGEMGDDDGDGEVDMEMAFDVDDMDDMFGDDDGFDEDDMDEDDDDMLDEEDDFL